MTRRERTALHASGDVTAIWSGLSPYTKGAVVGVLIGVVLIASLISYRVLAGTPVSSRVLVMLALKNEQGVVVPRTLALYDRSGPEPTVEYLDPMTPALVPGTSGQTIRDAFPFGGGESVAGMVADDLDIETPDWVVVTPEVWSGLASSRTLSLDAPRRLQAFSAGRLFAYEAGRRSVPASEAAVILDAADYLSSVERVRVTRSVGRLLAEAFAKDAPPVETNLAPDMVGSWSKVLHNATETR